MDAAHTLVVNSIISTNLEAEPGELGEVDLTVLVIVEVVEQSSRLLRA